VPQWPFTEPLNPQAIDMMTEAYFANDHKISAMLEAMFNSDFFKAEDVRFARIKSPAEMVAGTLKLAGGVEMPSMELYTASKVCSYMGQELFNPPSVEGWYGGTEWINTGAYVQRINFASKILGNVHKPGVHAIIEQVKEQATGGKIGAQELVDICLDLLGPLPVLESTRAGMIEYASRWGEQDVNDAETEKNIAAMVQLVVTTQEYQMA
jgi:hypothetical protein